MRVVEQLILHFWERGLLSRTEARHLIDRGFVRKEALLAWGVPVRAGNQPGRAADPWPCQHPDQEDVLAGRLPGKGKRGKVRPRPTGHDLVPLRALLAGHFAEREPFAALRELGNRLRPCAGWVEAATAVGGADLPELERALVALLNARPRALGELWFWADVGPLAAWAGGPQNAGPVASALATLLRATTPTEAGRIDQLVKAEEVKALLALLAGRRRFLAVLPRLAGLHFAQLGRWLVPPAGQAAGCWPALPWAMVLLYNARQTDGPPPGYPVAWEALSRPLQVLAWATFVAMEPGRAPGLLSEDFVGGGGAAAATRPEAVDRLRPTGLVCPLTWRV